MNFPQSITATTETQATLGELEDRYSRATLLLADMYARGENRWVRAAQLDVVREAQAARDAARDRWRLACLEQRWSNPGTDGPNG